MTNHYIYHVPGIKIGVTINVPRRMKEQGFTEWEHLETHTCIYEVSDREQELQRLYGLPVDLVPYHVTYLMTQNSERNAKISTAQLNNTNGAGNKGRIFSKESKDKMRSSALGKTKSEETKQKMSDVRKGIPQPNISAAKKGVPKPKVTCPHCQKIGGNSQMTRYHFDNCKHK